MCIEDIYGNMLRKGNMIFIKINTQKLLTTQNSDTTMEEAILKLMKVEAANMAAFYQCGCDPELVVDSILTEASLKIHEEARQELIDYLKTLN